MSLFAWQYWSVVLMELQIPYNEVEKLQISSANWMDGMGRSYREGGSQLVLKANIMSAIKRLKRSGDRGSPWRRPTFVVKDWPSLAPTLMQDVAWTYICSTSWQKSGPKRHMTILRSRRVSIIRRLVEEY